MRRILIVIGVVLAAHYCYVMANYGTLQSLTSHNEELSQTLRSLEQRLHEVEKRADRAKAIAQKLNHLTTDSEIATVSRDDLTINESKMAQLTLADLKELQAQKIESELLDERSEIVARDLGKQVLSLSRLVDYFEEQKELRVILPSIRPVVGTLTSPFGPRLDPYSGEAAMHSGVDFAAAEGTKIVAPAFGRVVFSANDGLLGNLLIIDHGAGFQTQYGHLKEALVSVGATVERGQPIAQVGNTGKSTGPHLHYEIRKLGIPVNPMQFIID